MPRPSPRPTPSVLLLLAFAALPIAAAAPESPRAGLVPPASWTWFSPPGNPALRGTWIVGSENAPGLYALRVELAAGGRIALHAHPDTRYSTVLSGTLYVGFDDTTSPPFAVPAGGVYVAPANRPHHLWAKDGVVVYQEAGFGPTGNLPVPAAPAPTVPAPR
jgi:mannose-6-phosphate isomerase-like protein (cupin superfamily)